MGIRFRRDDRVVGTADRRGRARVRRQSQRVGLLARRQDRMHLLVVQGRRRRAHGGQRRALSRMASTSRCSATCAPTSTAWTRRPARRSGRSKVDDHPFARITGAPTYANGRLYVPVSSIEEVAGARPNYPCCTFRGSVIALDAATGKQFWKSYMIPEQPKIVGKNSAGTEQWEAAGVAVWTSPTIDVAKNMIYVATGNAYTEPAAPTSDAVVALNMTDGAIQWVQQVDAQRRLRHRLQARRRELSGRSGSGLRFRQLADPSYAAWRPADPHVGSEVGRRLRHRSGRQGQNPLAGPRRQGRRARRDRMGLCGGRAEHLRPRIRRAAAPDEAGGLHAVSSRPAKSRGAHRRRR